MYQESSLKSDENRTFLLILQRFGMFGLQPSWFSLAKFGDVGETRYLCGDFDISFVLSFEPELSIFKKECKIGLDLGGSHEFPIATCYLSYIPEDEYGFHFDCGEGTCDRDTHKGLFNAISEIIGNVSEEPTTLE